MKLRFYFVRHGRTLFNETGLFQGWCDSPLSKEGKKQVEDTGSYLRNVSFQKAFSSTSERALDTANAICQFQSVSPITLKALKEIEFGSLDGEEIEPHREEIETCVINSSCSTTGGESKEEFQARMKSAMDQMIAQCNDGDTVLMVSHGMYFLLMLEPLFGMDHIAYRQHRKKEGKPFIENGGFAIFDYEDGKFTLVQEPMSATEARKRDNKKIQFYFMRHGETKFNVEKRMQGVCDSPLTGTGIQQAKKAKEVLSKVHFDRAYVSTTERTRDTAQVLLEDTDTEIVTTKKLLEVDFGTLEGKPYLNILDQLQERHANELWEDLGGENYEQIQTRIKEIFRDIVDIEKDGATILIVSHGKTYLNTLEALFGESRNLYFESCEKQGIQPIPNTGISTFIFQHGQFELQSYMKEPKYYG